jgi:hypothetical protein
MEGKQKTKYRIGVGMSIVLIAIAVIFDAASVIPFVGTLMGPIFWVISGVYLWTKGVGFFGVKKIATTAISLVAEVVPLSQELPMLVAGIIALLVIIRVEDKTGMSIVKPMKAGITPPRLKRIPKNINGVRKPDNYTANDEDLTLAA